MTQYRKRFRLELITPQGRLSNLEVCSTVFPAIDGQIGILGGRAPVVTIIGAGALVAETNDAQRVEYFVAGGYASMDGDVLTVLAEQCIPVEKIDREQAWAELAEAQKLPKSARRNTEVSAAKAKFDMVQRHLGRQKERAEALGTGAAAPPRAGPAA